MAVTPGRAVRTVPWFGAAQGLKRRYETLHPSAQMIGLQLWLPLFFVILFAVCVPAGGMTGHAQHQLMQLAAAGATADGLPAEEEESAGSATEAAIEETSEFRPRRR